VIAPLPERYRTCAVRVNLAQLHPALAAFEKIWTETYPDYVYSYYFLDERIQRFYKQDNITFRLVQLFAGIAILISCLGLYGLVSFMALQKTKEIGVRKVLGAGVMSLWSMLSKDFLKLTGLSMLIAIPLAYIGMDQWLEEGYKYYRADLSWWIFASAGAGILLVTLLTVSYQALKAAFMNPVRSLRSE
jgi:ABC-type antimicrobial peptide transport system permease subunit